MELTDILFPAIGGMLIGLAAVLLLAFNGRVMGMIGIFSGLVTWSDEPGWRLAFVLGSIAAPLLLALTGFEVVSEIEATPVMLVIAGLLVGYGTSLGSGCTSGHGICGMARLSPRSIAASACFMAVGFLTVALVRHVF